MKALSKEAKFLKGFSGIKVGKICKKFGYDISNIQKGRSTREKEVEVFNELVKEVLELVINVYLEKEIEVIEDEKRKSKI